MKKYYIYQGNIQLKESYDTYEEAQKIALEKIQNGEEDILIGMVDNSYWSQYQNRKLNWAETFCR